jgi:hypothetical protein
MVCLGLKCESELPEETALNNAVGPCMVDPSTQEVEAEDQESRVRLAYIARP